MNLLYTILLLLSLQGCAGTEPPAARISFTGDIIMHIPVKNCAAERNLIDAATKMTLNNGGYDFLFERVRETLSLSDAAVGNMEFPVSPPFTSRPMIFNCPPDVLKALKKSGFTMMHVANNHVMDQDAAGAMNTLRYLKESGLDTLGMTFTEDEARAGTVKTIRGIRVGFIGYTDVMNYPLPRKNGGFSINLLNRRDRVADDIARIRPLCDYLVMVVHTGEEYAAEPLPSTKKLLRECVDLGVDLVVGHHPHVLQPAEKVIARDGRRCVIFYSLGNFISNQSSVHPVSGTDPALSTRDSVILTLRLVKDKEKIVPSFMVDPIITVNERPLGSKRVIQTVLLSERIRQVRAGSGVGPAAGQAELPGLQKRLRAIRDTIFRYGPIEGVEFIMP